MKKNIANFVGGLCAFVLIGSAEAAPMDLSGFSVMENQPGSVTENNGVVNFTESLSDAALYFYNDFYDVDASATTLSFDYDFTLGQLDLGDYLQFNINFSEQWFVDATGFGRVSFDLTPYQGFPISLDWALIWGGDETAGTTASISNISVSPVPLPASVFLFGTGLAGLFGASRKRKFLKSSK